MENTGKVFFENDSPQWYIALGENWVGPLTASDVYQRVVKQEISWAHFVWKPGQAAWERICDLKSFQTVVPQIPGKQMQKEIKEASRPSLKKEPEKKKSAPPTAPAKRDKTWFLHFNESQFGPFSSGEVDAFLKSGKISGRVYAWKEGMGNWERLEKLSDFDVPKTAQAGAKGEPKAEQRSAPRKPLVAKIMMANDRTVVTAVCRDISVGGLQALTDKIPGPVGTRVRMNVSVGDGKVAPFVAEGVVVRHLEDGRGFSFRFEKISDDAKRTIESYVRTAR